MPARPFREAIFTTGRPLFTFKELLRRDIFDLKNESEIVQGFRTVKSLSGHAKINGVVPGVRGQRAFPIAGLRGFDPFLMLDHIGPQSVGSGFRVEGAAHPHRGFETITFMFEGLMRHVDSLGNQVLLSSGSVQRMNAGRGIQHGGIMEADPLTTIFHEVQLWVNVAAEDKMSPPDIHNVAAADIPLVEQENCHVRVIAGEILDSRGPLETKANIIAAHAIAHRSGAVSLWTIPAKCNALVYVLRGSIRADGRDVPEYNSLVFNNDGGTILFEADAGAQVLVIAGEPLKEAVVMDGPFVMNTKEEIDQAYADYAAGLFGTVAESQAH